MVSAAQEQTTKTVTLFDSVPEPISPAHEGNPVESELALREQLSHSLDIEHLLATFFNYLPVAYSGYRYCNQLLDCDHQTGNDAANRVEYRLVLADEHLGNLSVHRTTPFSFEELGLIEERLCALVYPMRNATLYQAALKSAFRDPLTGVENRAALENRLPREIQLSQRHSTPASLLVLDVDRFKSINDSHGHHTGDLVLQRLVGVFQSLLRTTDLICRYGGDEFVIVLSNTDAAGALYAAERIRQKVENLRVQVGNVRLVLSISIGLTELRCDDDAMSIFERADAALLQAKQHGRNNVILT
jgi:diguanylate cyclase (GGDEF)-like protein